MVFENRMLRRIIRKRDKVRGNLKIIIMKNFVNCHTSPDLLEYVTQEKRGGLSRKRI
jgi:hypothetical protein